MSGKHRPSLRTVRKILGDFEVGGIEKIEKIPTSGNITFRIDSALGKYVLRLCPEGERWRSREEIAAELELIDHLHKFDFPAPRPVRKKDGSRIVEWQNEYGCLRKYEEGSALVNPTPAEVQEFGRVFGWFHKLVEGYKTKHKREHIWDLKQTKKYFEEDKTHILKSNFKNKVWFVKKLEEEFSKLAFPEGLSKGMIHEDLGRRHVLWEKGRITCILDFDRTYYGKLVLDLGQALRGWCFVDNWHRWSKNNFKALLKGYQSKRKLISREKKYLYDAVKFAILERGLAFCLRFIGVTNMPSDEQFARRSVSDTDLLGMLEKERKDFQKV